MGENPQGGAKRNKVEHLLQVGSWLGFVVGPLHSMVNTSWPTLPEMCRPVPLCAPT